MRIMNIGRTVGSGQGGRLKTKFAVVLGAKKQEVHFKFQLMTIKAIYQFVCSYKEQTIDITVLFEHTPVIFINVELPELSAFNPVYS